MGGGTSSSSPFLQSHVVLSAEDLSSMFMGKGAEVEANVALQPQQPEELVREPLVVTSQPPSSSIDDKNANEHHQKKAEMENERFAQECCATLKNIEESERKERRLRTMKLELAQERQEAAAQNVKERQEEAPLPRPRRTMKSLARAMSSPSLATMGGNRKKGIKKLFQNKATRRVSRSSRTSPREETNSNGNESKNNDNAEASRNDRAGTSSGSTKGGGRRSLLASSKTSSNNSSNSNSNSLGHRMKRSVSVGSMRNLMMSDVFNGSNSTRNLMTSCSTMSSERTKDEYCYYDSNGELITQHSNEEESEATNTKASSSGGMSHSISSPHMATRDTDEDYLCVDLNNPYGATTAAAQQEEAHIRELTTVVVAPSPTKLKPLCAGGGMTRSISSAHMAKRCERLIHQEQHDDQDDYHNRLESDYEICAYDDEDTTPSSYYPTRDKTTSPSGDAAKKFASTAHHQHHSSSCGTLATVSVTDDYSASHCGYSTQSDGSASLCYSLTPAFLPLKSVLKTVSAYPAKKKQTKPDEDSETATHRRPKTRFTEIDEVILTISIDDMTDDEIQATWLTKFEKKSIQRSCERIIQLVSDFGAASSSSNAGRKLCTRGLEQYGGMTDFQAEQYELTREEVLHEQDEQHEFDYHDVEAIAEAYRSSGMVQSSKCIAEFRALQDREEVKKYYHLTIW